MPRLWISLFALALATASCSNADLVQAKGEFVVERTQVEGTLCAPPDLTLDVPYRVLFVIDTSLSNEWNDPTKRRVEAVRNAINAHITDPNVSFGVITFSDVPRVQTLSFTRDMVVLGGAIRNVGNTQGATNFSDTMWVAKSFILEDLNAMPVASASRVHYLIFWVSDGFPTVGTTDSASLLPMAATWREMMSPRVAEFRLDTLFLGARTSSAAEATEAANAKALLSGMATQGRGQFTDVALNESVQFTIDAAPMRALFGLETVVAVNQNAALAATGPVPDSDADGLSDEQEIEAGLDPLREDTDGDGYRDGVEAASNGTLNPLIADPECTQAIDIDGDGLLDCEEHMMGTSLVRADTDHDWLPDGVEVLAGASPLDARASTDRDGDGVTDQVEARTRLLVREPTSVEYAQKWQYRYSVQPLPKKTAESPSCYQVVVENLVLVATKQTESRPAGANVIEIIAGYGVEGGDEQRWFGIKTEARVLPDGYIALPPNGRFEIGETPLTPYPTPRL